MELPPTRELHRVTLPDADRTVEAIDGEELQARSFTAEKLTAGTRNGNPAAAAVLVR
jgi:hypothetical protein